MFDTKEAIVAFALQVIKKKRNSCSKNSRLACPGKSLFILI